MNYTWHWVFHSDVLQCDCGGVHYEKDSEEIYTSVDECIMVGLENKPPGNNNVLVVKEIRTIPAKIKFMENVKNRLKTFENWPNRGKPTPHQLAENGFYFTGHYDGVECYSCGLRLKNWRASDSPLEEHRKYSKKCLFNRQFLPGGSQAKQQFDVTGHDMNELVCKFSEMQIE